MAYINYDVTITWDYTGPVNLSGYYAFIGYGGSVFNKGIYQYVAYCGSEYTIGDLYWYTGRVGGVYSKGNICYIGYAGSSLKDIYYQFVGLAGSVYYPYAAYYGIGLMVFESGYRFVAHHGVIGGVFHLLPTPQISITYVRDKLKKPYVLIKGYMYKPGDQLYAEKRKTTEKTYVFVNKATVDNDGWFRIIDDLVEPGLYEYRIIVESTNMIYTYYLDIPSVNIFRKNGTPNFTFEKICA